MLSMCDYEMHKLCVTLLRKQRNRCAGDPGKRSALITPPITKEVALSIINERDSDIVQKYVSEIDHVLRTAWQGEVIGVPTDQEELPDHVVRKVVEIIQSAGWAIRYVKGGSSQRDGSWCGYFNVN